VRRLLPNRLLALVLFVMWLLLTQSFSAGQMLLGAVAAILGSHALVVLRPARPRLGSVRPALRLAGIVAADILRSNIAVAAIILFPRRARVDGFVRLPLDLQSRHGLAVLALIITATPGTIWVEFDRAESVLLIHVLDLVDEAQWMRLIKGRYEVLLLEIFGG
jgi:multicomponent K+:H+ antiporter subunit E